MKRWVQKIRDGIRLGQLSTRLVAGRLFWIWLLLPAAWIGFQAFRLAVGWRVEDFVPADAQSVLIGFPLVGLATLFGVGIIAGEIDGRTLEIAYTVPGGAQRVWLAKLGAALALLLVAEALAATVTFLLCTDFPFGALYGALQAAVFYLVLSMALSALFRSWVTGAMITVAILVANAFAQGANLRVSPFFNPTGLRGFDPADVIAWTVQNRIGFALLSAAVLLIAFARAERREQLLGG